MTGGKVLGRSYDPVTGLETKNIDKTTRETVAHHKSAKKRITRNENRKVRNKTYLNSVRTAGKKFRLGAEELTTGAKDLAGVQPLLISAQSMLAKAAAKGIIPKNTAERKIGRLAKLLDRSAKAEGTATAAKSTGKKKTAKKKTSKKTSKKS